MAKDSEGKKFNRISGYVRKVEGKKQTVSRIFDLTGRTQREVTTYSNC